MKQVRLTAVFAGIAVLAVVAVAQGAKIRNGNFEKGNFSGWKTKSTPAAKWKIYDKRHRVVTSPAAKLDVGIKLPKPIGKYSPFIDMFEVSHSVLYRDIKIPKHAKSLKLKAFWHNDAAYWHQTGTFKSPNDGDQYLSIDLIKPSADPETNSKSDILEKIFAPRKDSGGPPMVRSARVARGNYINDWKGFKASVKKYRGDKVTLRLAEVATVSYNYTGIDNVKVK